MHNENVYIKLRCEDRIEPTHGVYTVNFYDVVEVGSGIETIILGQEGFADDSSKGETPYREIRLTNTTISIPNYASWYSGRTILLERFGTGGKVTFIPQPQIGPFTIPSFKKELEKYMNIDCHCHYFIRSINEIPYSTDRVNMEVMFSNSNSKDGDKRVILVD